MNRPLQGPAGSGDLWSIRRYIVGGFLTIAVLLALETAFVVHASRRVERELEWLSRSSLIEVESANAAALALRQALNAVAVGDEALVRREISHALSELERARSATEAGARLEERTKAPGSLETERAEIDEWLEPLFAAAGSWRSEVSAALAGGGIDASRLAEIESRLESDVLRPLRAYQKNASDELSAQVAALELEAEQAVRATWISSVATLAVALALSVALAAAVSGPIAARRRAEDRLRRALDEKDTLLREVQHRVKNNLQVVTSLLDLQARGNRDEGLREILGEVHGRVTAMSLLHEQLCAESGKIDTRRYFESLLANVARSHGRAAPLPVHGDPAALGLDPDRLMSVGLIVNELASNALEHGGAGVDVRFARANGNVEVVVADDGPGFDERTDRGLGLTLVEALARDLGGRLDVESEHGLRARVAFPLRVSHAGRTG